MSNTAREAARTVFPTPPSNSVPFRAKLFGRRDADPSLAHTASTEASTADVYSNNNSNYADRPRSANANRALFEDTLHLLDRRRKGKPGVSWVDDVDSRRPSGKVGSKDLIRRAASSDEELQRPIVTKGRQRPQTGDRTRKVPSSPSSTSSFDSRENEKVAKQRPGEIRRSERHSERSSRSPGASARKTQARQGGRIRKIVKSSDQDDDDEDETKHAFAENHTTTEEDSSSSLDLPPNYTPLKYKKKDRGIAKVNGRSDDDPVEQRRHHKSAVRPPSKRATPRNGKGRGSPRLPSKAGKLPKKSEKRRSMVVSKDSESDHYTSNRQRAGNRVRYTRNDSETTTESYSETVASSDQASDDESEDQTHTGTPRQVIRSPRLLSEADGALSVERKLPPRLGSELPAPVSTVTKSSRNSWEEGPLLKAVNPSCIGRAGDTVQGRRARKELSWENLTLDQWQGVKDAAEEMISQMSLRVISRPRLISERYFADPDKADEERRRYGLLAKCRGAVPSLMKTLRELPEIECCWHCKAPPPANLALMVSQADRQIKEPNPIQMQVWPAALHHMDILGQASTGTGKTLAFLIPAIAHIYSQVITDPRQCPIAVIVEPTRELSFQVGKVLRRMNPGIAVEVTVGGQGNLGIEIDNLRRKPPALLIGTVARLASVCPANNLVRCGGNRNRLARMPPTLPFYNVSFLVLDEADALLSQINRNNSTMTNMLLLLKSLMHPEVQTLMFSATFPKDVSYLARSLLSTTGVVINPEKNYEALTRVEHHFEELEQQERVNEAALHKVLRKVLKENLTKILVFCRSCAEVDALYENIPKTEPFPPAYKAHSLMQDIDRKQTYDVFYKAEKAILVATDLYARGIDIPSLDVVVHYNVPRSGEDFVHRTGRCGRQGRAARSYIFVDQFEFSEFGSAILFTLARAGVELPAKYKAQAIALLSALN